MEQPSIFSATLGLCHPWQVTSISFDNEGKRMDICVDLAHGCALTCPRCGSEGRVCRTEVETWYHDDFFHYKTFLHAQMPRVECCGDNFPTERPWLRSGSRFTQLGGDEGYCPAASAG